MPRGHISKAPSPTKFNFEGWRTVPDPIVLDDRGNCLEIEQIARAKTEFNQKSSAPLFNSMAL